MSNNLTKDDYAALFQEHMPNSASKHPVKASHIAQAEKLRTFNADLRFKDDKFSNSSYYKSSCGHKVLKTSQVAKSDTGHDSTKHSSAAQNTYYSSYQSSYLSVWGPSAHPQSYASGGGINTNVRTSRQQRKRKSHRPVSEGGDIGGLHTITANLSNVNVKLPKAAHRQSVRGRKDMDGCLGLIAEDKAYEIQEKLKQSTIRRNGSRATAKRPDDD
ncbi:hypothetical protein EDD21DRAFT_440213 [Dissophora ornata]|nr:hypothetical protein BGZ58_005734 [Dissophora ornata]KAI8605576.1 hypothetical protein EDD21DRAFT_440213 [Dissophora ornata]